jgi:hypothetical protein
MSTSQQYEAEKDVPVASLGEDEWSTELERLAAKLEAELRDVTESAVRESAATIRAFERRGLRLLQQVEERRREADDEQKAMLARTAEMQAHISALEKEIEEERRRAEDEAATMVSQANRRADSIVAQAETRSAEVTREAEERLRVADEQEREVMARVTDLRTNIATVESEIEEERGRAEAEAESILDEARHRAEAIVAEAEARAADMLAAAHNEAASRRAMPSGRRAAGTGTGAAGEDRLRGLSARVGQLLETRTPGAAPEMPTPTAQVTPMAPPTPPIEEHHAEPEASNIEIDEAPTVETRPVEPAAQTWRVVTHDDDEDERPTAAYGDAEPEREPEYPARSYAEPETVRPATTPAHEDEPEAPAEIHAVHPVADEDEEDSRPTAPHSIAREEAPADPVTPPARPAPVVASGPVSQTVIFQSVPNFQAAPALERSLKGMPDVREVRVADFDEKQLTFQVTHELGDQLARVLLDQRGSELQLVEARADRIELSFRT